VRAAVSTIGIAAHRTPSRLRIDQDWKRRGVSRTLRHVFGSLLDVFTIFKMVFGFGLVVFIHEFGHFLMARRHGVFVEQFTIGFDFFGARLATWRHNGTEYVIGAFPFGGYVKMLGQHELPSDGETVSRRPDSFQAKTIGQRAWIMSAGVIANFASAFVLCFFAILIGYHEKPPIVSNVGFNSLEAGLRPGDEVKFIAGRKIGNWQSLYVTYATQEQGAKIDFVVDRDGRELTIPMTVRREGGDDFNMPDFGVPAEPRIKTLVADSRALEAGLALGDRLLAVDGEKIESWSHFAALIRRRGETDTVLTVEREQEDGTLLRLDIDARPDSRRPQLAPLKVLGVEPQGEARIDFVAPESTGYAAGLRVGDVIEAVEGRLATSWYDVWKHVSTRHPEGAPVRLRVRSDSGTREISVPQGPAQSWGLYTHGLSTLGLAVRAPERLVFGAPTPGGAAAEAGLREGDVAVEMTADVGAVKESCGGEEPELWVVDDPAWETLLIAQKNLKAESYQLVVERGGNRVTLTLTPQDDPEDLQVGFIGVGPMNHERLVKASAVHSILPSLVAPVQMLKDQIIGMRALFIGRLSTKMVSGPVGILQATYHYAEQSTGDLLRFLALLSVNLAVVNFLPIPITDGGHFMFLMYEHFKGRRMDEEIEARFQWAGLVFILMVFVMATFNDVARLFKF
jgi:regulator of sigma E protease